MGWTFLDNSGRIKELLQAAGINPTRTVYSAAASGTYTTPQGCTAILVECVGAGGGSSGCAASGTTSQGSLGAGGGGGAYAAKLIKNPSASYAYVVGAGGSAGTFNTGGGNGTDTTFGSTIVVAKAGSGGTDIENWNGGPAFSIGGGGGQASSCVGDITVSGQQPFGWRYSTVYIETRGGAAAPPYGALAISGGSRSGGVGGAGSNGLYPGGGAQPGFDTNNTNRAGALGADGLIVITEFYGVQAKPSSAPQINFTTQDFSLGPPSNPNNGDIWYATTGGNGGVGELRYNGSSWIPVGETLLWDSLMAGVSATASSITTASLPQYYTNLRIVWKATSASAALDALIMRFNGDTSAHYYWTQFYDQNGTIAQSGSGSSLTASPNCGFVTQVSGFPGGGEWTIADYSTATYHPATGKSHAENTSAPTWIVGTHGLQWNQATAITTITFLLSTGPNFTTHRFSVYGS